MKRTFIIDNGGEYSDHALAFVETDASEADVADLIGLAGRARSWRTEPFVSGVIDGGVAWLRKGPGTLTPRALVGDWLMSGWGSTWTEEQLRDHGCFGADDAAEAKLAHSIWTLLERIDPLP